MNSHQTICFLPFLLVWFNPVLEAGGVHPPPSLADADLIYEFLLSGMEINEDGVVLLLDEEMASMRQGRDFLSRINDDVPRSPSSAEAMLRTLEAPRKPLNLAQFQQLVLSMVYSAHRAGGRGGSEAWAGVLLQLANITVYDLRSSFLYNYA